MESIGPSKKSNAITNFINQFRQYRGASKQLADFNSKIKKIDYKVKDQGEYYIGSKDLERIKREKLEDLHNNKADLYDKIKEAKRLGNDTTELEKNLKIAHHDINVKDDELFNKEMKSEKILRVQNKLHNASLKQFWKKRDLEKELEQNPFMKTDKFIRAHQTPIKAALAVPVVGGTIYGGKKAIDHLTTPPVVTAPTVAPTALPPATPPDVKPPPNHFSDNAGKYGAALGGVAAAGLGALALRRYMKKKKDK